MTGLLRRTFYETVILWPFEKSDLDDLAALNGDAETMKYISAPLAREQVAGVMGVM